jgi:hypothetical protein
MAEITDTEVVAPDMRRVTLGELSLKVPPSPTLKYMFFIRRFVQKFQDGTIADTDIEGCFEQTVEFLSRYNKNIDEEKLLETCELTDLITFYSNCFGQADEEADEQEAPPPRPTRRGTSGARKTRPSRSVSST